MDLTQTVVSDEKLDEWCDRLPECKDFLQEFFYTCSSHPFKENLFNYVHDIRIQQKIDPDWKFYEKELMHAFREIAYRPGELN